MRMLVVEDEPGMASVLRRGLSESGFAVDVAADGEDGLWMATENDYDVAVVDLMLPGMDGLTLLRRLRQKERWTPVLLLTALDGVADRVLGLDLGADDYLTKPFAFSELLARLRALLRRGARERPATLVVGDLTLDPAAREVCRAGRVIALTPKEFALLECLMRYPGQVVSKAQLIENGWDYGFESDSNVVEVYVGQVRRKVDRPFSRRTLETVRGAGYRVRDDGAAG